MNVPGLTTSGPADTPPAPRVTGIDPRGPRFGAALMSVLLAATVLAGQGTAGFVLLGIAAALFAVGVARGAQGTLQGWLFRTVVRPRLGPPAELEDPRPPRFAQGIGLAVTLVGLVVGVAGAPVAVPVAAAVALAAAFLNAVFDLCLGCELYLLLRRLAPARA